MKNKKLIIFLIVLLSIGIIGLTAFLIYGINNNFHFSFNINSSESTNLVLSKEYDNTFDLINIDGKAVNINILNTESDKIKVLVYGDENKNDINVVDNGLNIISNNTKCKFFCINVKIAKIEVYVPDDYDKKIKINNDYGNINIEKFDNINLDIDTNYGDIKIDSCSNLIIRNDYGDIKVNTINNYLDIDENFGDIKIDNLIINKNSSINNDFGNIKINGTNKINIDAKTSLGDIDINNNYKDSDIILKIKNNLGDIKINN